MGFILLCLSLYLITYASAKWINENYYRALSTYSFVPPPLNRWLFHFSPSLIYISLVCKMKLLLFYHSLWFHLCSFKQFSHREMSIFVLSLNSEMLQMGKLTLKEFCSCDNYPLCSHLWNAKYQWHLIRIGRRTACATNLILAQQAAIVWKCMHLCISIIYMHVCIAGVV